MIKQTDSHAHYEKVEQAIRYIVDHHLQQPSLKELADAVGMSEFHFQRMFTQWAGVSPKQFLQYLTKEHAKQALRTSSVLDAALASGLSGSSRLHDLFITYESVTPGEYRSWGNGIQIDYGVHSCQFGYCFLAVTQRGICKLAFFDTDQELSILIKELHNEWKNAVIREAVSVTQKTLDLIFNQSHQTGRLHMLLKGTPFRVQVWQALLNIPEGKLASYQHIAESIGKPSSARAVASAIANNQIGYLIPCHRVIRGTGALSEYRWGKIRKAALIGWEKSQIEKASPQK